MKTKPLVCSMRGLSLIELLAALVILSIATTLFIGVAGPMTAGQRTTSAIDAAIRALQRARLLGQRSGGSTLQVDGTLLTARPLQVNAATPLRFIHTALPAGFSCQIVVDDEAQEQLNFDAAGRCQDAVVEIRSRKNGELSAAITLLGLTGQTRVARAPQLEVSR